MPPKNATKASYGLHDDNDQPLEPEPYMDYLDKKLRTAARQAEINPPAELISTIRSVIDTEDKTRKGVPFATVLFTNATEPPQLSLAFQILSIYPLLEDVYLNGIVMTSKLTDQLFNFLKNVSVNCLTLFSPGMNQEAICLLFSRLKDTQIEILTIKEQKMDGDSLITAGIQIEKYAVEAMKKAEFTVADAIQKHNELLELEAQNQDKKKKKQKAKKKKGIEVWEQQPIELFQDFFKLSSINLEYCMLDEVCAPALSVFVEKVACLVTDLSLYGNALKSQGLEAIGIGLQRAYATVEHIKNDDHQLIKETYTGSRLIKLVELNIAQNQIEDNQEACHTFGAGIHKCGNIKEINMDKNTFKQLKDLVSWFQKQWSLLKVVVPVTCHPQEVEGLAEDLKIHRKKGDDVAKQMKRIQKDAKKRGKDVPAVQSQDTDRK